MIHPRLFITLALSATLAHTLPAGADGTAAAQYLTGNLAIDVSGPDVSMQLRLPMTRAEASTANKQNLTPEEVVTRLKAADKLFVFPDKARCQPEYANAFAVDAQGKPTKADGNIQAMYRFRCDGATSARVDALKVKLFDNLPGLEKLKLQLSTDKGDSTLELTPATGDVAL
jgi:Protein of unknown function (DUF2796)